jgi:branched-chain amino acid transport system permease protein
MQKTAVPLAILSVFLISLQLLTTATGTQYYLTQLTMSAYYGLLVIGLCLLMGYAGQISIGHAGFFAIGGYLSAALTTNNLLPYETQPLVVFLQKFHLLRTWENLNGETLLTLHPWAAALVAISTAALIALIVGIPVLKLRGHYLAMATLGFGIIIYRIVLALPYFGEADGISEVPGFSVLPAGLLAENGFIINGESDQPIFNYYFAWVLLILGLTLLLNLTRSRAGRSLQALHGSEDAAEASGINTSRTKLQVFVLSAVYAALAGVLLTHFNGGIGPAEASVMKSVRYVALVAVGGMTSLWGSMLMGAGLSFLSLRGVFGSYDDAIFAVILLAIMLFAPGGFASIVAYLPWKRQQVFLPNKETEHA